jgi:hypothetical protein
VSFSPNFEAFGVENQNYAINSGSVMVVLSIIILQSIFFVLLNMIAKIFFRFEKWRKVGVYVSENNLIH